MEDFFSLLTEILSFYWTQFQYDWTWLSTTAQGSILGWLWCLFYLIFFYIKWAILTAPFWYPLRKVAEVFKKKDED